MVSHSNFLSQYYIALNPTKSEADYQRSFGFRLMGDTPPPSWLQPINYAVSGELAGLETIVFVRLFKVIP